MALKCLRKSRLKEKNVSSLERCSRSKFETQEAKEDSSRTQREIEMTHQGGSDRHRPARDNALTTARCTLRIVVLADSPMLW